MQSKFLRSLIYILLGIALCIFLLTQPFNAYCRLTKKCYPITLSSFAIIKKGQKEITINFESKVDDEIKDIVEFSPDKKSLIKFSNEYITNSYIVKNLSKEEINIRAKYKATPSKADKYLERIECLCFQSEYLEAGEEIKMPIRFQIKDGIDSSKIEDINISYEIEIL